MTMSPRNKWKSETTLAEHINTEKDVLLKSFKEVGDNRKELDYVRIRMQFKAEYKKSSTLQEQYQTLIYKLEAPNKQEISIIFKLRPYTTSCGIYVDKRG